MTRAGASAAVLPAACCRPRCAAARLRLPALMPPPSVLSVIFRICASLRISFVSASRGTQRNIKCGDEALSCAAIERCGELDEENAGRDGTGNVVHWRQDVCAGHG